MMAPYPASEPSKIDEKAEAIVATIKTVVSAARNLRSTMGVSPALKPAGYISGYPQAVSANLASISAISRVEFKLVEALPQRDSPVAITDSGKVMLHIEVDREAERARLTKEKERTEAEIGNAKGKLSNPSFVDRAPAAVVEQERKRLADLEAKLANLAAQLGKAA
jgi:valyl-tRNA synthetase